MGREVSAVPHVVPVPRQTETNKAGSRENKYIKQTTTDPSRDGAPGHRLEWKTHDAVAILYRIRIRGCGVNWPPNQSIRQKRNKGGFWSFGRKRRRRTLVQQPSKASLARSHDLLAYCALIEGALVGLSTPSTLETERPDRKWTPSTADSITRHTFWRFLESHTFQ